jgi:hypothetical protein
VPSYPYRFERTFTFANKIPFEEGLSATLFVKIFKEGEFIGKDQFEFRLFTQFGVCSKICISVNVDTKKITQDRGCIITETTVSGKKGEYSK